MKSLTMFSTGRGDTAHCFLMPLGPRRLKRRYVPMKHCLVILFMCSLFPLSTSAADMVCAPQTLLKVVTTIEAPDLPPDHFYRVPKILYRAGERQGRIEEALNPESGVHLLIVVNEPDLWMVNLADGKGQYLRDPGPTFYFRARLFGDAAVNSTFIRNLEIGCEVAWLLETGVKPEQTKHPTLGAVNKLEFTEGSERLVLFERRGKPLRVELFGASGWIMAMNYLSYEPNLKKNPKLFIKPVGVIFESKSGT